MTLIWGTYPRAGLGTPAGLGEGLWSQPSSRAQAALAEQLPAPSFVLAHPTLPLIYAASETPASTVSCVTLEGVASGAGEDGASTTLQIVATMPTGGADACHLLLAPDARTLYVSHYSSGDVAVIQVGVDGLFVADAPVQRVGHAGSGPRKDRQEGPHAHSAMIAPGGNHLLVFDLGTDEVRRYRLGAGGILEDAGIATVMPPGSGPRHAVVRGNLIYVTCELDHMVRTLRWDARSATAEIIAEQPATLVAPRTAELHDAHIDLIPGSLIGTGLLDHGHGPGPGSGAARPAAGPGTRGDVLLVSVRGADVISLFDVAPEGEITYRGAFDAGHWPRYFAAVEGMLLVGEERGHRVRMFALSDVLALAPEQGLGDIQDLPYLTTEVISPACVAAVAGAPTSGT